MHVPLQVSIFRDAASIMFDFINQINSEGFNLQYLNFGGGLGIDYSHSGEQYPAPRCAPAPVRPNIAACSWSRGCCSRHSLPHKQTLIPP